MPEWKGIEVTRSRSRRRIARLRHLRRCLSRPRTRPRHSSRRSTWPAAAAPRAERENWDFFLDAARTRPPQDQGLAAYASSRCSSRCSNSPAPAPAAAKRLTSSCSRSCSATAPSSPTPPVAPRSTAATCRPRPGRKNAEGRGPAWTNSLFEDNAEFGLGFRAVDRQADRNLPRELLQEACAARRRRTRRQRSSTANQKDEADIYDQRERVALLKAKAARVSISATPSSCLPLPTCS